jgi:hypothetical protein
LSAEVPLHALLAGRCEQQAAAARQTAGTGRAFIALGFLPLQLLLLTIKRDLLGFARAADLLILLGLRCRLFGRRLVGE